MTTEITYIDGMTCSACGYAVERAVLDGVGYHCDPTSDRGGHTLFFLRTPQSLAENGRYIWDQAFLDRLVPPKNDR